MTLYQSLKAIFLHIDNHEKAFLSQFDLSIPRFYVLYHINKHPGINYMDLSDLMLCTKSNTTRIIKGMQAEGLIDRHSHPDDGRSFQLWLTPAGQALFDKVYPDYEKLVDRLMARFDSKEIIAYTEISQHIESTLAPQGGVALPAGYSSARGAASQGVLR